MKRQVESKSCKTWRGKDEWFYSVLAAGYLLQHESCSVSVVERIVVEEKDWLAKDFENEGITKTIQKKIHCWCLRSMIASVADSKVTEMQANSPIREKEGRKEGRG